LTGVNKVISFVAITNKIFVQLKKYIIMKKLVLLLAVIFSLGFIACDAEKEDVTLTQDTGSQELLTTKSDGVQIIYLNIGRHKYNCNDIWGVCKICFFCAGEDQPDYDKAIEQINEQIEQIQDTYNGTSSTSHDSHFELPISDDYMNQIGENMIVDEDVISEDGNYKIVQGEYLYQSDIGEYGGYRIHIVVN